MDKTIVLVTTDAENLQVVDITGAMTPAFIRERIFSKVRPWAYLAKETVRYEHAFALLSAPNLG